MCVRVFWVVHNLRAIKILFESYSEILKPGIDEQSYRELEFLPFIEHSLPIVMKAVHTVTAGFYKG
jgi:hypothetical protein